MAQHKADISSKENMAPIITGEDVVSYRKVSNDKKVEAEPHSESGRTRKPGVHPVALGTRVDSEQKNGGTGREV